MSTSEEIVTASTNETDASLAAPHRSTKVFHYGSLIAAYIANCKYPYLTSVGFLILLLTFAMGSVALVITIVIKEDPVMLAKLTQLNLEKESQRRAMILDNMLLEYENVCKDLQIFAHMEYNAESEGDALMEQTDDLYVADSEANDITASGDESMRMDANEIHDIKHKHAKVKNGNGHSRLNGSRISKVKSGKKHENTKKDQPIKKNSTAEPIIYLFALVFIYLLLKAASDINQHYKSQAKGDKRLRRCSLQSYAQTHKQDRRASKGIATKNMFKA